MTTERTTAPPKCTRFSGIYKIENIINKKFYVGSASCINTRINNHKSILRKNSHYNKILQNAWNKYGESNFIFTPLIFCDKELLLYFEQLFIDGLQPKYNIAQNARAPHYGRKLSPEHRKKIGIGSLKNWTDERKIKQSLRMRGNQITRG